MLDEVLMWILSFDNIMPSQLFIWKHYNVGLYLIKSSRVLKCDVIKFSFFAFQHFHNHISVEHDENPQTPNLTWIDSWWPEYGPHEYLINPIEISVIGLVHYYLEPGQFTLTSMGLIRYSCSHISWPHEPIPIKFWLWMFFIMLHRCMVSKTLKCK